MSRRKQLRKKLKKGAVRPAVESLAAADPRERGRAVRSCCPCRVGWESYEANRDDVERLCKDEDSTVQFNALHVRGDALLMEALAARNERRQEAVARRDERQVAKVMTRGRALRRQEKAGVHPNA